MNIVEAMEFFSPSRTHVKESLISPDEDDPHSYGIQILFFYYYIINLL